MVHPIVLALFTHAGAQYAFNPDRRYGGGSKTSGSGRITADINGRAFS